MRSKTLFSLFLSSVIFHSPVHAFTVVTHFWDGPCPEGVPIIDNGCLFGATTSLPGTVDLNDGVVSLREGFLTAMQNWSGVIDDDVTVEVAPYMFVPNPGFESFVGVASWLSVLLEKNRGNSQGSSYTTMIKLLKQKAARDLAADASRGQDTDDALLNMQLTHSLPGINHINADVDPDNSLPLTNTPSLLVTMAQLRALGVRPNTVAQFPALTDIEPMPQIPDPDTSELRFIDGMIGFNASELIGFDPNPADGIDGTHFTAEDFQHAVLEYIQGNQAEPFPAGARDIPRVHDFVGTATHQMGHILGAVLTTRNSADPGVLGDATDVADLFRFHEEMAATINKKSDFRDAERHWLLNPLGTPHETMDVTGQALNRFESFLDCIFDPDLGLLADPVALACRERENNVHVYGVANGAALTEGVYNGEFGGAIHLKDDTPFVFDINQRCAGGGDFACRFVASDAERRSLMAAFIIPFFKYQIRDPDLNVFNNLGWNINRNGLAQQNQPLNLTHLPFFEGGDVGTTPSTAKRGGMSLKRFVQDEGLQVSIVPGTIKESPHR